MSWLSRWNARMGMPDGSRAQQGARLGAMAGPFGAALGYGVGRLLDSRGNAQIGEAGLNNSTAMNDRLAASIWGEASGSPARSAAGAGAGIPGTGIPLLSAANSPDSGQSPLLSELGMTDWSGAPAATSGGGSHSGGSPVMSGSSFSGGNNWGGGTSGAILSNTGLAGAVQNFGGWGGDPSGGQRLGDSADIFGRTFVLAK